MITIAQANPTQQRQITGEKMMSKDIGFKIAISAYVLGAVLTFGHSYRNIEIEEAVFISEDEKRASGAIVCGIAFPLYWSVQAFK